MDYSKLFLLVLALWGIVLFDQTEASTSDTWTRDQTSRSLLQNGIPNTCNAETNVRWYDDAPPAYRNISSPGSCCEFCQQTPSCSAWVWTTIGQACYLLDTVGDERFCSRCTGGILGDAPIANEDIDDYLQRCANQGGTAARAAATAACIVLTDICAPAAPEQQDFARAGFESFTGRVEEVLEGSCDSVFSQTCQTESRNQANNVNPGCGAILERGPGESRDGCEDLDAANRLFDDQLTELCDSSDD